MEKLRRPSRAEVLPESESSLTGPEAKRRSFAESYRGFVNRFNRSPEVARPMSRRQEFVSKLREKRPVVAEIDTTFVVERVPDPAADRELQRAAERLRQAYLAAELSLPEEARLERSHEVKDDEPSELTDEQAQSIGKILADIHQKTAADHQAYRHKSGARSKGAGAFGQLRPMYRRLILAAFYVGGAVWLAVIIVWLTKT